MNTAEIVDHVYRVQNLARLYGYEIRHWDHAGSVYLKRPEDTGLPDNIAKATDFIGKVNWTLETWIERLKTNRTARGVR